MDNRKVSRVAETFQGKTVLLTGTTGFLGKLVLEKLLRSCPQIKRIYIIVRAKKGKDENQRRNEILESEIFEPLKRKTIENIEEKVKVISGDLAVPNSGISLADQEKLLEETNFVFHLAATVRFDEKIKTAVNINIKGTRDMLKLAKQMKRLEGFVYVSTAYSFCPRHEIDEKFYDPPYEVDKIINVVNSLDDDLLEYITPKMLKDWPNTYSLTKSIAEHVIKTESEGLPSCIVRPSIVVSTYQEPLPGWTSNFNGAVGALTGAIVGLTKTTLMKPSKIADLVPADFVVNCIISAAWDIANNRKNRLNEPVGYNENQIKIYNYTSGLENPISWAQTCRYTKEVGDSIPSVKGVWYNCFVPSRTKLIHDILIMVLHIIPAYIVDFIVKCFGRKPRLMETYRKIHKFSGVLHYFSINDWKFNNVNINTLWNKLNPEDKTLFPFSMKLVKWEDYFQACVKGIRVYLLKDPMDTVEEGRTHYRKLKIYHYSVLTIFFTLLLAFSYSFFKTFFKLLL